MSQLKVYLVEDSPLIRERLVATLEELAPLKVVGTCDEEASAVEWLARHGDEIDVAIVDIFLSSGSGLGILRAARAASTSYRLVVLSNFATPDVRRRCLQLGADRVFDKSNDIEALIQYCNRLASGETSDTVPSALQ